MTWSWSLLHPTINAGLNLTCFIFLMMGKAAINRGDQVTHKRRMLAAFYTSAIFLVSYLARFATTGAHMYPGHGLDRIFYLTMLMSHMILAVVLVPLVIGALRRALRGDLDGHRKIVKFTWPIWVYVSATGVLVFLMLYLLAPALHPGG